MFNRIKLYSIFIVLAAFLVIAAQCGAVTPVAPPAEEVVVEAAGGQAGQTRGGAAEHEHDVNEAVELAPVSLAGGEKLKVVATTGIIADIVSNVGGDLIDLTVLLPPGTDPHTFEPTPSDLAKVANAHLIFANGLGLEVFLDKMIKNAGGEAAVVYVSQGIKIRRFVDSDQQEHAQESQRGGVDPHSWTTPANAIVFTGNIEHALSALDPTNAEVYQANARAYEAKLEDLDAWVKQQIESIPPDNRKLVADHAVFGYYAGRYGLQQIGAVVPAFSTVAEPSAQELAGLVEAIRQYKARAVFVGSTVNPALAQRLADDTGIQLVTLYTGSLGPEGSGAETYLDYIRYNTTAIVDALNTPIPTPTDTPTSPPTKKQTSPPAEIPPSSTTPQAANSPTSTTNKADEIPVYTYEIVNVYPHDRNAFTQGLIFEDGFLYEGTGRRGQSTLRKIELETGQVLQLLPLPDQLFGEGVTIFGDRIIQLTWQSHLGFVYDKDSFELLRSFNYPTEGWGITHDGQRLIMSDGTSTLYFWDPDTLEEIGRIEVYDNNGPVIKLNELEYIQGEIYANVWQTNRIARIDPQTGRVVGWLELAGLLEPEDFSQPVDVLNGIAYDAQKNRLFVTGKLWPKLFEIKLIPLESQ